MSDPVDDTAFDLLDELYRGGLIKLLPVDMRLRIKTVVDPDDEPDLDMTEADRKDMLKRMHARATETLDKMSKLTIIEQMVEPVLSYCDEHDWVCKVTVEIQQQNGTGVQSFHAHGDHELDSDKESEL